MTMHLLGPAYTTTQNNRRQSKLTDSKFNKWAQAWRDDVKWCKKNGIKPRTLDEYISYRQGNYKPKLRGTPMPQYNVSDHRKKYPSQNEIGVTFAKTPNTYTGDKLIGIATMHKSNSVPVFNHEDAIEIARMRRG